MKVSDNYQTFVDAIAGISVTDVVCLRKFCERMKEALAPNDIRATHCLQDFNEEMRTIDYIIGLMSTEKTCPHCGNPLYTADLPQYDYTCPDCDENFYECEVK